MPILMGRRSGNDLRASLTQNIETVRADAGIRGKDKIKTGTEARTALRTLGLHLAPAAKGGQTLLQECLNSALFADLPFTLADFTAAMTRVEDSATAESKIQGLAGDAKAEAVDARGQLAFMIVTLWQAQTAILANPAVKESTKDLVRTAGAELETAFGERKEYVQTRRVTAAEVRGKDTIIEEAHSRLSEYETEDELRDAEKELKLRVLSGEALRPADLVRTPVPPARGGRRRPDEGPAPPTEPKGRRQRPR